MKIQYAMVMEVLIVTMPIMKGCSMFASLALTAVYSVSLLYVTFSLFPAAWSCLFISMWSSLLPQAQMRLKMFRAFAEHNIPGSSPSTHTIIIKLAVHMYFYLCNCAITDQICFFKFDYADIKWIL